MGPQFSTFLTYRSATSPDIILGNSRIFHNTHISPGKILTSSDHNYIVFTISTSPIQVPIVERESISRADWVKYRSVLSTQPVHYESQLTCVELDRITEKWTADIIDASGKCIPKSKFKTLPHFRSSHETRLLQIQYEALTEDIRRHGTNYGTQNRLNHLRQEIQTLLRHLYGQAWDNIISRIDIETNPKKFWTDIKKTTGK